MTEPTKQTIKRLFALSGNVCAFPNCELPMVDSSGVVTGQICHIHAKSESGPRFNRLLSIKELHDFDNLILLCGYHHKVIDDKPEIYTAKALYELKDSHESTVGRSERLEDNFYAQRLLNAYERLAIVGNTGNVAINSPGSIQGTTVTVNTRHRKVKIEAPSGTLGADPTLSRYIAHLISRYNEFASKDPSRKVKFNFGAVSKNVEAKFGSRWQLLGTEHAQEVIEYLQSRINRTRLARINKASGYPAFSTLHEYVEKYGKK